MPRNDLPRSDAPHVDMPRAETPGVARQLNDAISRLDARLSQISNPAPRQARCRTGSARPRWSSAPPARSIAPRRRSARRRSILRSRKSPRARTNSMLPPRGRCRRAARRPEPQPIQLPCRLRWRRRCGPHADGAPDAARCTRGAGFFLAGTASDQDHQPDRGAAASRRYRAIDHRIPRRAGGHSRRHHRGDAAPGDRIDRKRNPLAVAPHRRLPARAAPTARRWPASNARCPKFAKCCSR